MKDGSLPDVESMDDVDGHITEDLHESSVQYAQDLKEAAADVVNSLNIDQWVAVLYDDEWYPGCVQEVKL